VEYPEKAHMTKV